MPFLKLQLARGNYTADRSVASGNKDFAEQVSKWVFQEKSVLKLFSYKHHRIGETAQHGIYRIKDNIVTKSNLRHSKQTFKNGQETNGPHTRAQMSSLKQ
jgi:Oligosaccharyltransferase 48 kDa subunit beta